MSAGGDGAAAAANAVDRSRCLPPAGLTTAPGSACRIPAVVEACRRAELVGSVQGGGSSGRVRTAWAASSTAAPSHRHWALPGPLASVLVHHGARGLGRQQLCSPDPPGWPQLGQRGPTAVGRLRMGQSGRPDAQKPPMRRGCRQRCRSRWLLGCDPWSWTCNPQAVSPQKHCSSNKTPAPPMQP